MRVKFRLCTDSKGNKLTRVFFVDDKGDLELITQMSGWIGMDIDTMGPDSINKIAETLATKADDTKYIE